MIFKKKQGSNEAEKRNSILDAGDERTCYIQMDNWKESSSQRQFLTDLIPAQKAI